VPKKQTWNLASVAETLKESKHYGFATPDNISFDFASFKKARDTKIKGLNSIYENNWNREKIDLVHGTASFVDKNSIEVSPVDGGEKVRFTAKHICIATGGHPSLPKDVEGAEYGITSDGFFSIEKLPKKIAVVGAGYIAVELAGVLNALGVETHLYIRHETFLRSFDPMIQEIMTPHYEEVGVHVHKSHKGFAKVEQIKGGEPGNKELKLTGNDGEVIEVNEILWAIGRAPEIEALKPESVGVKLKASGHIEVDEFQNTSVPGIYALGDVSGQVELTPGKSYSIIKPLFGLLALA
jgi:glutathione reductase (NADPH)